MSLGVPVSALRSCNIDTYVSEVFHYGCIVYRAASRVTSSLQKFLKQADVLLFNSRNYVRKGATRVSVLLGF